MRYQGGKARTAARIAPFLVRHAEPGATYHEPFLGAGSIAGVAANLVAALEARRAQTGGA